MLTATAITKYFPESDETQKEHMCQNKQGLCSTKTINDEQEPQVIYAPQPRMRETCVQIKNMKHIMYTIQTTISGCVKLRKQIYHGALQIEGNLILVEPMKKRTSGKMCKAYDRLMCRMNQSGIII